MDEGRFQDTTRHYFHHNLHLHLIYNIGVSPVSAILSPRLFELIRWLLKAGGFFCCLFHRCLLEYRIHKKGPAAAGPLFIN